MNSRAVLEGLRNEVARLDARRGALVHAIAALEDLDQPTKAPRATPAAARAKSSATDENIYTAIKAGHETKKALQAETKLPIYNLSQGLKRLIAAKRIAATGATSQRRFTLRGAK